MSDFVRYRIPLTQIDGPPLEAGTAAAIKLLVTVEGVDDNPVFAGTPMLRVRDWAGPWAEAHDPGPEPGPIPPRVLEECSAALVAAWESERPGGCTPEWAAMLTRAVLEQVGRMLHPADDDAVSLMLGVARLDVRKLTKSGDLMAAMLHDVAERSPELLGESAEGALDLLALWKGQAHRDWSDHHARKAVT